MNKIKSPRTVAEIEAEIAAAPSLDRRGYVIARALDRLIAENEMALQIQLAGINVVFIPNRKDAELKVHDITSAIDNAQGGVFSVSTNPTARKLAELRELKSVLDTPATRAAIERLDPLFAELAVAQEAEAAAERIAADKRQILRDELEARRAAALAELERDEAEALAAV